MKWSKTWHVVSEKYIVAKIDSVDFFNIIVLTIECYLSFPPNISNIYVITVE